MLLSGEHESMINVLFQTESHFPVKRQVVREALETALSGRVKRDTEISVSIVGDRRMRQLNKQYRGLDQTTDVLSFGLHEEARGDAPFVEPPDDVLRLGDIVVSYPQTVVGAGEENMLVDEKMIELILHGLNHLLGIHHPE